MKFVELRNVGTDGEDVFEPAENLAKVQREGVTLIPATRDGVAGYDVYEPGELVPTEQAAGGM